MRSPASRVLASLAVAGSVLSAAQLSGPARADDAGPVTTTYSAPGLASVDCVNPTACMAVGSHSFGRSTVGPGTAGTVRNHTKPLVVGWDGRSWRELSFPALPVAASPSEDRFGELTSISCVAKPQGGAALAGINCVAIGSYGSQYNEYSQDPDDARSLDGLLTAVWNGASWRVQPTPVVCGLYDPCDSRRQVQCTSPQQCYAVGEAQAYENDPGRPHAFWRWDGTRWTAERIPYGTTGGLACWADGQCAIAGSGGDNPPYRPQVLFIDGGRRTYVDVSAPGHDGSLGDISCTDRSFCLAAAERGYSLTLTPGRRRYHLMQRADDYSFVSLHNLGNHRPLDCPHRGFCLIVGVAHPYSARSARVAEKYVGSRWVITRRPGRAAPDHAAESSDVSCARPSLCFALGPLYSVDLDNSDGRDGVASGDVPGAGLITRWNGHGWADKPVQVTAYDPTD